MTLEATARITIAGAGAAGCYLGGCLAAAGRDVTLLGRPGPMQAIARQGLRVSDHEGRDIHLEPHLLAATAEPETAFAEAEVVLVTVKSGGTRAMAELIAAQAPADAVVVSLQNGVGNVPVVEAVLGRHRVVAGMVPFNLVQTTDQDGIPHAHRATGGRIHIAAGRPDLLALLDVPGARTIAHPDMAAIAWGKLVMNLNNALNALAGIPLREELADRHWRRILADQAAEALRAIKAAGLRTARIDGVDPRLIPHVLRLPDTLFRLVARAMLAIDPKARSSMWDDLEKRRMTEIDELQGAVLELAARVGLPTPTCIRVHSLIRAAEAAKRGSPGLTPEEVDGHIRPPSSS